MYCNVVKVWIDQNISRTQIAVKEFTSDMIPVYGFILVQLVHMLFLTIQGQFVVDSYENIYSQM